MSMGRIWTACLLAAALAGCGPRAPRKPAGVSQEAFWVGDRKAGAFVDLGPKEREGWRVRIYDDHSGALKADAVFVLRGLARSEIAREEFVGYDGHALRLSDGALMVPRP